MEYEPDPLVMCQDEVYSADNLIELTPNLPAVPKNDLDDNNAKGAVSKIYSMLIVDIIMAQY